MSCDIHKDRPATVRAGWGSTNYQTATLCDECLKELGDKLRPTLITGQTYLILSPVGGQQQ